MTSQPDGFGFRSLTTRLIAWILLACGAIFAVTLRVSNTASRATAEQVARQELEAEARAIIASIDASARRVEDSAALLAATVETLDPTDAELEALLRRFVGAHPRLFGAAAAFEPGGFRPGIERFAPYVYRHGTSRDILVRRDLATDSYRYFEREWYAAPVSSRQARWSEPYMDEAGGQLRMVTFSAPIFRPTSAGPRVRGVVSADLTLDWLNETVQGLADVSAHAPAGGQAASNHADRRELLGRVAIVSREGIVLAAHRLRLGERLIDQLGPGRHPELEALLAGPATDERPRLGAVVVAGEPHFLAWVRHRRTGWLITVLYPAAQVLASVRRLALVQAGLSLGGLALLTVVVVALARRVTQPLADLTAAAGRLATGDLDADLPSVRSRDEIGRLTGAFRDMRDSLKAYIRDLAETTKAKARMESELRAARGIQMAMLPKATAGGKADGYELAATLVPARQVGGDLYDHFTQGSRVYFMVGDVSGKGVPAALFMARTKMLFETIAARETDPGAVLHKLNQGLAAENDAGMFVTIVCGALDVATGELVVSCGGHEPPVHLADGTAASLEVTGGPLIGLIDGSSFPVNALRLAPGESIVMYTDGVSEATSSDGDMFGTERLVAMLSGGAWDDASAVTESILGAVRAFAGDAPQSDDITIMTLRYLPRLGG